MIDAPLPSPLHARLTVVRADADPTEAACRVAAALVGDAVDLRPAATAAAVITAAVVHDEAARRCAEALERRTAARDDAVAHRSGVAARRAHLLERAEWSEMTATTARTLTVALAEAEERVATALAAADQAGARRDRVAQQRAAAQAAVDEARLELEGLDGTARDETGIRRQLDAAARAQHDAEVALRAAEAEVAALESRQLELGEARLRLAAERAELEARIAAEGGVPVGEPEVREALGRYERHAENCGIDPSASGLADAITAIDAELADLRARLPEPPTDGRLEGAEADVAAARRRADAVRSAASSFTGPAPAWWVELTALHGVVVDAEAALAGGGFRKAVARRRKAYEDAVAAERAMLEELGFASYLDALMSGGKRHEEQAANKQLVAEATARLTQAEQALEQLNADLLAGAPIVVCLEERQRLLGDARNLLACDPGDRAAELLRDHAHVPPTVLGDLAAALRIAGIPTTGVGVARAARRWITARDEVCDTGRLAALDAELAEVVAELHAVEGALGPARAVAERAGIDASAAARTASSLETELRTRAGDEARLLERAAAARALRDQVEAVEARLAQAEADALQSWATATELLAAAEAERERVDLELGDIARRAARAAADLPDDRRPAFDLVNGLGPLAAAFRAEASALGVALDLADTAVAEAEAACGRGPDHPTAADVEAAVRSLIAAAPTGVPAVLAEPFEGLTGDDLERLLDVVVDATSERPTIVVTADLAIVGWAIGLPSEVGGLVPARSMEALATSPSGPAASRSPATDAAVPARPLSD